MHNHNSQQNNALEAFDNQEGLYIRVKYLKNRMILNNYLKTKMTGTYNVV